LAVSNGTAATALREEWGLATNFVVAYAGNLGRVHDLEPVLALAGLLRDAPAISFLFVGDGPQRAALEAAVRQRGLSNVIFRPPQPRARLAEVLAVGDLHLVTLRSGCERYVFPSKLYGIAATGRPVLFIGPSDCEIARLVRDRSLGWTATRDEVATLAAIIRQCAREAPASAPPRAAALRFAEQHAASVAIDRWHELLLATVGSGRSTTGRATPSAP
jgi:glycosyltransferase involved in cell wall biosynthesis